MSSAVSGIGGFGMNYSEQIQGSNTALGQMDFLELLMIQLQYQDPLSPMDSQEFSAQLAQFSQLEQITQMNQNLSASMQTNLLLAQSVNNVMATNMIGQSVVAFGNEVELIDGQEADINYELSGSAQTVTIEIKNENGVVVRTIEASGQSSGDQQVVWDGLDDDGNELADGIYTYSVTAKTAGDVDVAVTTFTSGTITGVAYVQGMAELLVGSIQIGLGDIYRIVESS
jgi:flagellar basal-body rod modification protein FlgD